MKAQPQTFDVAKERAEQDGTEYKLGALSQPSLINIPLEEREKWLYSDLQFSEFTDYSDCATRWGINSLEAQLTYGYQTNTLPQPVRDFLEGKNSLNVSYIVNGRVVLSNRFNATLSGTTRQGNSLKAPLQSIYSDGIVPKSLLPEEHLTFEQYHSLSAITKAIKDLGQESKKYIKTNYEQVNKLHFAETSKDEIVGCGIHAYPAAVNGVYPPTNATPNHAVGIFKPKYFILDNYGENNDNTDFFKELHPNYNFFDWGYRLYISGFATAHPSTVSLLQEIANFLQLLTVYCKAFKDVCFPPPPAPNRADILYNAAYKTIGKDASPDDLADDRLGCAESVSTLIRQTFPDLHFPITLSTRELFLYLSKSPSFKQIDSPKRGCIVLNVTGSGNGTIAHGHVGIMGNTWIMSNHSNSGTWEATHTLDNWKRYYQTKGGMPTLYFSLA